MDPPSSGLAAVWSRVCRPWPLPPIVERELRLAARRGGTYWGRVGVTLIALAIAGWWLLSKETLTAQRQSGLWLFRLLGALAAVSVTHRVLNLSAAAFAREKREDTLGFLFLTPLKPRDLVLGKFVACTLDAFYQFLAIVPVLALPLLAGGVTFEEFVLLVLALANFAFFNAGLGLYVSARCWDERGALRAATFTWLGAILLVPFVGLVFGPIVCVVLGFPVDRLFNGSFVPSLSPAYAVWEATVGGPSQPSAFWTSVLVSHGLGWLCLWVTCRILPRCWQDRPSAPKGERFPHFRREPTTAGGLADGNAPIPAIASAGPVGTTPRRARRRSVRPLRRAELLDQNPLVWFAWRWGNGGWSIGILTALILGLGLLIPLLIGSVRLLVHPLYGLFLSYSVNAALKFHLAAQAALAFARDRPENSLELLLATPVTPGELVQSYALALSEPLRRTVLTALTVEAVWLTLTLSFQWSRLSGAERQISFFVGAAVLGLLIPDLRAVGWTALWEGAVARDSKIAAGNAASKVLALPWVGLLTPLSLIEPRLLLGVLVAGSVLTDWWFARRAREKLATALRQIAQIRAAGQQEFPTDWVRLGRWLGRGWRRLGR